VQITNKCTEAVDMTSVGLAFVKNGNSASEFEKFVSLNGAGMTPVTSLASGRGLHSSTFQLNFISLYGIGGARRGCVAGVRRVLGVFRVCRVFSCVRHGSS